jgi:lipoprotein signal peptidase
MAIVATVSFVDGFGRQTTKRIETTATTIADAQSQVAAYLVDLNPLTDLQAVGATFSMKDPGQVFVGTATSNLDVGATFRVRLESGKLASHKIAGFPLSLVGSGGAINVADALVQAYFNNFKTTGELRLSDGEAITDVETGELDK